MEHMDGLPDDLSLPSVDKTRCMEDKGEGHSGKWAFMGGLAL